MARVGELGGGEEARWPIGTSSSGIVIGAEKRERKDVEKAKLMRRKGHVPIPVPRRVASRQRTKDAARLAPKTVPGITPTCATLNMSQMWNQRRLTWCDNAATWAKGEVFVGVIEG